MKKVLLSILLVLGAFVSVFGQTVYQTCGDAESNAAFALTVGTAFDLQTTNAADGSEAYTSADAGVTLTTFSYIKVTIPSDGTYSLTLNDPTAGTTLTGDVSVGIHNACPVESANEALVGAYANGLETSCLYFTAGDYILVVGTVDAGVFDLRMTFTAQSSVPVNDRCDMAENIANPTDCTWSGVTSTSTDACPEGFGTQDGCDFSQGAYVWHSYTTPADTDFLDIRNLMITTGTGTPRVLVVQVTTDCDNVTPVSACITNAEAGTDGLGLANLIPVIAETTYYFVVGTDDPAGAVVEFDLRAVIPPSNDQCDAGDPAILSSPTGELTQGTTVCATAANDVFATCDGSTEPTAVYYNYTVPANVRELTINLVRTSGTGDMSIAAIGTASPSTACASTLYQSNPDSETCGPDPTLVLSCPTEGDVITFAISTAYLEQGTFDLTLTETQTVVVTNDKCNNPENIANPTDCTWAAVSSNSVSACPEWFMSGSCDLTQGAYVWHSYTVPLEATHLDIRNLSASVGTPTFLVVEQPTDCISTPTAVSNCITAAGTDGLGLADLIPVTAGSTYSFVVGTDDPAGAVVEFDLRAVIPPSNDMCDAGDASILSSPTGELTQGTTVCALAENDVIASCDGSQDPTAVYYNYTVPANVRELTITLVRTSGTGDMSIAALGTASPSTACANTFYQSNPNSETCGPDPTLVLSCPTEGDVITFAISTAYLEQGTFDLTLTETQTVVVTNDKCSNPENIANPTDCTWAPVSSNSVSACPENFEVSTPVACDFSQGAYVWHSYTTPAGTEFIDVRNLTASTGTPRVIIVENDCATLTTVSGCITDAQAGTNDGLGAGNLIPVTAGTTYYFVVGTDDPAGAVVDFEIKPIIPPANDNCATGIETLVPGTMVPGSTICATEPVTGSACDADKTQTVWYTYTTTALDKELTISVDNFVHAAGSDQISVAVYTACDAATFIAQADGNNADYCGSGNTTDEEIRLSCLAEGTVLYIMVSSSAENEGTFEITLNSTTIDPNCVDNDLCENIDVTQFNDPIVTDNQMPTEECITDCNAGACPDDPINTICGQTIYNAVFYQFTTDNLDQSNEHFITATINGSGANPIQDPVILVVKGTCAGGYTQLDGSSCFTTGSTGPQNDGWTGSGTDGVEPNTVYTVIVGTENGVGGEFELCVKVTSGCVNDKPCDAVALTSLGLNTPTLVDNPATTTSCNNEFSNCGTAAQSTAWYSVLIPDGANKLRIDITNGTFSGPMSIIAIEEDDCNNIDVDAGVIPDDDVYFEECDVQGTVEIPCVKPGYTYFIQVGTQEDADEGDFNITFTPEKQGPDNDFCQTPTDINVAVNCEYQQVSGTLVDACPWVYMDGSCDYSVNPTVFYSITIPATVTSMDVRIGNGLNNPMLGIFSALDCNNPQSSTILEYGSENQNNGVSNGCITNPGGTERVPVTPGTTYYIAVSTTDMQEAAFILEVALNNPPDNDNACNSGEDASIEVSGTYNGNTCCARGNDEKDVDGNNVELDPQECSSPVGNQNVVWNHTTVDASADGYDLTFAGANMTIEVYWGAPDAGCNNGTMTVIDKDCSNGALDLKIPNCPPNAGDILHYRIASSENNCGDYTLTVVPASCSVPVADECPEAISVGSLVAPECDQVANGKFTDGCLYYACPDPSNGGCPAIDNNPTVWFQADFNDLAFSVVANVSTAGTWDPMISIYQGTDCSDLMILAPSCSNSSGSPTNLQVAVEQAMPAAGGSVWVAVSYDPNTVTPNTDLNFTLELTAERECIECTEEGACDYLDGAEVTNRSIRPNLDDILFCPGEEVNVCVEFAYDASQSGVDWIQGLMPRFGKGWDMTAFDPTSAVITPGGAVWSEEGTACAPMARQTFPLVRTYINDDGKLEYCHTGCESCPPGAGAVIAGDPMPSGWFWLSDGGSSTCVAGSCISTEQWGLPNSFGLTNVTICMDLKVKSEFQTSCEEERKLDISILPTSDALTGCWPSAIPCIRDDVLLFANDWEIDCVELPPVISSGPLEICSPDNIVINLSTEPGYDIKIYAIDNPDITRTGNPDLVSGDENNPTLAGSNIFDISETLENTSTSDQIQRYVFSSIDPNIICPSPNDTFEIIVHPKLEVTMDDVTICKGSCTTLDPSFNIPGTFTFLWSTGATTAQIEVCPTELTTYSVTVTNEFGCVGTADVTVDIRELPNVQIVDEDFAEIEEFFICAGTASDDYVQIVPPDVGTYTVISWSVEPNFGLDEDPLDEICNFDEENAVSGTYKLVVDVVDDLGCPGRDSIIVTVGESLNLAATYDINCGDTVIDLKICDTNDEPANFWRLYSCDSDGNYQSQLEDHQDLSGGTECHTFQNVDITANQCFIAVASREDINTSGVDVPCSQDSVMIVINPPTGDEIQAPQDAIICAGQDATLTVGNPGSFTTITWVNNTSGDTEGTGASITVTPTATTTYTINTVDPSGCTDTKQVVVTVNPIPVFTLPPTISFCTGTSGMASGPDGMTSYDWKIGGATVETSQTYSTSTAGVVVLTVTDANGCTHTASTEFVESTLTDLGNEDVVVCDDNAANMSLLGYSNYQWKDSNGDISGETNATFSTTTPGIYTVTFLDGSCNGTKQYTVISNPSPTADVTDEVNVCRKNNGLGPVTVDFTSHTGTSSAGTWSIFDPVTIVGGTFDFSDKTSVSFIDAVVGEYRFVYTTTTAVAPCENVTDTLTVKVDNCACPQIILTNIDPQCNTGTIDLSAFVDGVTPSGDWTVESGPTTPMPAGLITGSVFNLDDVAPGTYTLRYTLNPPSPGTCDKFKELTMTIEAKPVAGTLKEGTVCNITGGDPWTVDLDDLLTPGTTTGGVWTVVGTPAGIFDADNVFSGDGKTQGEIYTFRYTTPTSSTSVCDPVSTDVQVRIRNCNCPDVGVLPETLCTSGAQVDLTGYLTNPDNLVGSWTVAGSDNVVIAEAINGAQLDPTKLNAGVYTVTYTLDTEPNPGNGCSLVYSNSWTVNKQPEAVYKNAGNPCNVDTNTDDAVDPTMINLNDYLENGHSSGTWSLKSGDPITINPDGTVSFNGVEINKSFVFEFVTTVAKAPCDNVRVEVPITVTACDCPPIRLDKPDALCNDIGMLDLATLTTGSAPGRYDFRNAQGTAFNLMNGSTVDASLLDPGTYTIRYILDETVDSDCDQFLEQTLDIIEYKSVKVLKENAKACNKPNDNGSTVVDFTLLIENPLSGSWNDDDGSGVDLSNPMSVDFNGLPVGNSYRFTYTVDNAEPCKDASGTITITIDDCNCPQVSIVNPNPVCNNSELIDLFEDNDPNWPGTWSTNATEITITDGRYLDVSKATQSTYDLIYTANNLDSNCDPETVRIEISQQLTAGTGRTVEYCLGEEAVVELKQMLEGEDQGGVWTNESSAPSGVFSEGAATFDIGGAVPGTYTFKYAFIEQDPCEDVSTLVEVIIHDLPNADAGPDKIIDCDDPVAELGGNSSPAGQLSYRWRLLGSADPLTGNDGSTIVVEKEGDYELKVTHQTTTCVDQDSVNVTAEGEIPSIAISETQPLCFGETGSIVLSNPTGGSGNYTYTLNGEPFTDFNLSNLTSGDYVIQMTDVQSGCVKEYPAITIASLPEFIVDIPEAVVNGNFNQEYTFTYSLTSSDDGTVVTWTDSDGTVLCTGTPAECENITVTPSQNTTYTVTAVNANGCTTMDSVMVRLAEDVSIQFPNIIRPGSTDGNKVFYVLSKYAKTVKNMYIYDRWGELVYTVSDVPANDPQYGWSGNFNKTKDEVTNNSGQGVVPGVYTFLVELDMVDSQGNEAGEEVHTGDITVLR